jgi:hypothetical protein
MRTHLGGRSRRGRHQPKQVRRAPVTTDGRVILPGGSGPPGSVQPGWRGERRAWRQAEPDLTSPGTVGKSRGREELNHERPARACQ